MVWIWLPFVEFRLVQLIDISDSLLTRGWIMVIKDAETQQWCGFDCHDTRHDFYDYMIPGDETAECGLNSDLLALKARSLLLVCLL